MISQEKPAEDERVTTDHSVHPRGRMGHGEVLSPEDSSSNGTSGSRSHTLTVSYAWLIHIQSLDALKSQV